MPKCVIHNYVFLTSFREERAQWSVSWIWTEFRWQKVPRYVPTCVDRRDVSRATSKAVNTDKRECHSRNTAWNIPSIFFLLFRQTVRYNSWFQTTAEACFREIRKLFKLLYISYLINSLWRKIMNKMFTLRLFKVIFYQIIFL